jgi:hypothetical protein
MKIKDEALLIFHFGNMVRIHVRHENVDGGHPCIIFKMITWILSFRQQIKHISLVS